MLNRQRVFTLLTTIALLVVLSSAVGRSSSSVPSSPVPSLQDPPRPEATPPPEETPSPEETPKPSEEDPLFSGEVDDLVAGEVGDETPLPPSIYNVARASMGAVATASSYANTPPYYQPPAGAINGDRKGVNWWLGTGGWADGNPAVYPDWFQVQFSSAKKISEIDLFTLQDDNMNPVEPTPEMTFALYGLVNFQIQYWNGSAWITLANVVGNNKVWTKFNFPEVITTKIRVYITAAGYYSRIVELEAWGTDAFQSAALPANPGGCNDARDLGPCELTWSLYQAMKGTLPSGFRYGSTNWKNYFDWGFSNWAGNTPDGQFGSQNKPLLVAAIALWVPPGTYNEAGYDRAINWWKDFLDCQNGVKRDYELVPCQNKPVALSKFKSNELFSLDYDASVLIAVMSTRLWALRKNQPDLATKATVYLRNTWVFYTLASGQHEALLMKDRKSGASSWRDCQWAGEPPHLALAGMRSPIGWICGSNAQSDQRTFLFARARGLSVATRDRESIHNKEILNYMESLTPGESIYALTPAYRDIINRVTNGTGSGNPVQTFKADINFLVSFVKDIRTITTYHFLGFEKDGTTLLSEKPQIRVTLMAENKNPNTAPIFGAIYDGSGEGTNRVVAAKILYPYSIKLPPRCEGVPGLGPKWDPARKQIKQTGYGELLLLNGFPRGIEASNEARALRNQPTNNCVHEDYRALYERIDFSPTWEKSRLLFHIRLSSGAAPRLVVYP